MAAKVLSNAKQIKAPKKTKLINCILLISLMEVTLPKMVVPDERGKKMRPNIFRSIVMAVPLVP